MSAAGRVDVLTKPAVLVEEGDGGKGGKAAMRQVRSELATMNVSVAESLEEGLEEPEALHWAELFTELGRSVKTANCIENLNALIGQ